jgi:hypothetical protein
MMTPLLLGLAITFLTILVHAFALRMVITGVHGYVIAGRAGTWLWDMALVTSFTLLVLAAHLLEIALWAFSFLLCRELSNFSAAFYYSAATYTTLGDTTFSVSPRWRLLVPIEAADGMLMFGISTGIIFAIIHRLVMAKFAREDSTPLKSN